MNEIILGYPHFIIIITREILISALREWMVTLNKRATVAVSKIGKWKAANAN